MLSWPAGCQSQTPTSALCFIDSLQPAEQRTISFPVTQAFQNSDSPVSGQLSPVGLLELQSGNNIATVLVEGGASSQHLISNGTTPVNSVTPTTSSTRLNSTPSAARSSGALSQLWLMFIVLILLGRSSTLTAIKFA